jgi:hypothetical protein
MWFAVVCISETAGQFAVISDTCRKIEKTSRYFDNAPRLPSLTSDTTVIGLFVEGRN